MSKLIGSKPNQAPSNSDLGELAYQNKNDLVLGETQFGTNPNSYTGGYVFIHNPEGLTASTAAEASDHAALIIQPHATNSTHLAVAETAGGDAITMQVSNYTKTANWHLAVNPYTYGSLTVGTPSPGAQFHVAGNQGAAQGGRARFSTTWSDGNNGSGIDIIPSLVPGTETSPCIRFYDYANGHPDSSWNGNCDDNNWYIGADDTGVSSFKIVCGGPSLSPALTGFNGTSGYTSGAREAAIFTNDGFSKLHLYTQANSYNKLLSSVGGTTTNFHYNLTMTKGTFLVTATMELYHGTSDVDECMVEIRKDGVVFGKANIAQQDSQVSGGGTALSSYSGLDSVGVAVALVHCNGSENLQIACYTTDSGDAGGATYQLEYTIQRIGGDLYAS